MKKIVTKKIEKISVEAVPQVDINAPLKAPIEESTVYETAVTPKNRFLYILGLTGFVGISLLACSILIFYLTGFKGKAEYKGVIKVESKTSETQKSSFDRASVTFEVLNGSGVVGAAKKTADRVQGLGYRVIGMGNAEATKGNKLYLKNSATEFSQQILSDLTDFNISTVSGELTEGSASARLILGIKL